MSYAVAGSVFYSIGHRAAHGSKSSSTHERSLIERVIFVAFLFLLALPASLPAQNPQLELNEVKWSFPKVGMQLKEIGGVQAYDLGNNVYGVEDTNNGLSIRLIFIPTSIVVAAEKGHREDLRECPMSINF